MLGCTSNSRKEIRTRGAKYRVYNLIYIKDNKTGLCFAVYYLPREGYLTHVPCDKVKKFLEK